MKKRYNLSFGDIGLIELADIFGTLWVVGLFLVFAPRQTSEFLIEWKWAFFALAIVMGVRPLWKMLYGEKDIKSKKTKKVKRK